MKGYRTQEAAVLLAITPQRVAGLCRSGRIRARRDKGQWIIPEDEVARFRKTRRAGRPPGPARIYAGKSIGRRRAQVRQMVKEGRSVIEIAAELGVDPATVRRDKKALA